MATFKQYVGRSGRSTVFYKLTKPRRSIAFYISVRTIDAFTFSEIFREAVSEPPTEHHCYT